MARISTGSEPAELLMKFYWDTIDQCVPPETILDVLRGAGFVDVGRRVLFGFLSEYSPQNRCVGAPPAGAPPGRHRMANSAGSTPRSPWRLRKRSRPRL